MQREGNVNRRRGLLEREPGSAYESEGEVFQPRMPLPQRWEQGETERKKSEAGIETPAGAEGRNKQGAKEKARKSGKSELKVKKIVRQKLYHHLSFYKLEPTYFQTAFWAIYPHLLDGFSLLLFFIQSSSVTVRATMDTGSPRKIQFTVPLLDTHLDPEAAEQVRGRKWRMV